MFVTDKMIDEMAARFGSPATPSFDIPTPRDQIEFIRSTQKQGRNHDVTIYAIKAEQVVVIAKHFYPPKLYRAPSGGLNPGESFETGIAREMREEIGCEIELERFLIHTSVRFFDSGVDRERHTPSSEQVLKPPLSRGESVGPSYSGRQTSRSAPGDSIHWRSLVFLARVVSGDFKFTDTHEIKEVRLADWSEFELFGEIMRASDKAGLHYRAQLHEAVLGEL